MQWFRNGETYFTDKVAKDFACVIAEYVSHVTVIYLFPTLIYDLKELLHGADDFSVLCDGSTDRSETDKELIMIKIL